MITLIYNDYTIIIIEFMQNTLQTILYIFNTVPGNSVGLAASPQHLSTRFLIGHTHVK
jgi:hypothetical protein